MVLGAMDERSTVFEADFRSPPWAEVSAVRDDRALFGAVVLQSCPRA